VAGTNCGIFGGVRCTAVAHWREIYRFILHMQILNEFEVANFGFVGKLGGMRRFLTTKSEFEDVSHECSFELPTCCYLILLCCEVSVPMEKAANLLVFDCFKRGCNLVSCGMRGTF